MAKKAFFWEGDGDTSTCQFKMLPRPGCPLNIERSKEKHAGGINLGGVRLESFFAVPKIVSARHSSGHPVEPFTLILAPAFEQCCVRAGEATAFIFIIDGDEAFSREVAIVVDLKGAQAVPDWGNAAGFAASRQAIMDTR